MSTPRRSSSWSTRYRKVTTAIFSVAADADDEYVIRSGVAFPPTADTFTRFTSGTTAETSSNFEGGTNYIYRNLLLKWDTSSLPDAAVITGATLQFWCTIVLIQNRRNFVGEYYTWDGTSQIDRSGTPSATPPPQDGPSPPSAPTNDLRSTNDYRGASANWLPNIWPPGHSGRRAGLVRSIQREDKGYCQGKAGMQ
jgi:hypothetical protein